MRVARQKDEEEEEEGNVESAEPRPACPLQGAAGYPQHILNSLHTSSLLHLAILLSKLGSHLRYECNNFLTKDHTSRMCVEKGYKAAWRGVS